LPYMGIGKRGKVEKPSSRELLVLLTSTNCY
jgi:hypothetical protein